MAKVVSRRPLTAEARVRARVNPCGICGGQSGTGTGFSVFPCQYQYLQTHIIWGKRNMLTSVNYNDTQNFQPVLILGKFYQTSVHSRRAALQWREWLLEFYVFFWADGVSDSLV
jgi:hypothetical protein